MVETIVYVCNRVDNIAHNRLRCARSPVRKSLTTRGKEGRFAGNRTKCQYVRAGGRGVGRAEAGAPLESTYFVLRVDLRIRLTPYRKEEKVREATPGNGTFSGPVSVLRGVWPRPYFKAYPSICFLSCRHHSPKKTPSHAQLAISCPIDGDTTILTFLSVVPSSLASLILSTLSSELPAFLS